MSRGRLRDLGINIGTYTPGPLNTITDVPDVWVGHTTLIYDQPSVARTGITMVVPRAGEIHQDPVFAGYHSFNGCGDMTGLLWVQESGCLMSPVALTNTAQVGLVRDSLVAYGPERLGGAGYWLPVVAETWDGWLNDSHTFSLTKEHVFQALDSAAGGPVAEGAVGGGTGMICHDFKGGIGTASRIVESQGVRYTVGALVQTNYGERDQLRIDGVPVGREIGPAHTPLPWSAPTPSSSIIVVLATDAPLLPDQCRRLAQRATVGLARCGGVGQQFSGDIFLAFSTGNHYDRAAKTPVEVRMLPLHEFNAFFDASAEAVEESILNALVAAETMTGKEGHTAYALPLDELQRVMARYRPSA